MSLLGNLLKERREMRQLARNEDWKHDEEPLSAFEAFFAPILDGKTIKEIVDRIRKEKGEVSALNLMGGLTVFSDLNVDVARALRLSAKQPDSRVVTGDVASRLTWKKLDRKFDIILSLARAGSYQLEEEEHRQLVATMIWEHLESPGLALLQLDIASLNELRDWIGPLVLQQKAHVVLQRVVDPTDKTPYLAVAIGKR